MMDLKAFIDGDEAIQAKLTQIGTAGSGRAMRASVRVGQKMFEVGIKAQIPPATTPGHDMTAFLNAVGSRFIRQRTSGITTAKTGINVGKRKKPLSQTPKAKHARMYRKAIKAGLWKVGTQRMPHFHLLALGTGRRSNHFGANRGLVRPGGYIPRAVATVAAAAGVAMENKLLERIYAEAAKGAGK